MDTISTSLRNNGSKSFQLGGPFNSPQSCLFNPLALTDFSIFQDPWRIQRSSSLLSLPSFAGSEGASEGAPLRLSITFAVLRAKLTWHLGGRGRKGEKGAMYKWCLLKVWGFLPPPLLPVLNQYNLPSSVHIPHFRHTLCVVSLRTMDWERERAQKCRIFG